MECKIIFITWFFSLWTRFPCVFCRLPFYYSTDTVHKVTQLFLISLNLKQLTQSEKVKNTFDTIQRYIWKKVLLYLTKEYILFKPEMCVYFKGFSKMVLYFT